MMQTLPLIVGRQPKCPPSDLKAMIQFTRRELEIIGLLETNYNYQQLAKKFFISESTLRFHLKNIYRKFKVRNRSGAIAQARALGMETRNGASSVSF